MKTNQAGIDLIKSFEGFRSSTYKCPAGKWTIGYGSTYLADGSPVTKNTPSITEPEAEALLKTTLITYEQGVQKLVKVNITENQFAALVSFAYNLGVNSLATSTLLAKLNNGDTTGASQNFEQWCMIKDPATGRYSQSPGLKRRRLAEVQLFNQR